MDINEQLNLLIDLNYIRKRSTKLIKVITKYQKELRLPFPIHISSEKNTVRVGVCDLEYTEALPSITLDNVSPSEMVFAYKMLKSPSAIDRAIIMASYEIDEYVAPSDCTDNLKHACFLLFWDGTPFGLSNLRRAIGIIDNMQKGNFDNVRDLCSIVLWGGCHELSAVGRMIFDNVDLAWSIMLENKAISNHEITEMLLTQLKERESAFMEEIILKNKYLICLKDGTMQYSNNESFLSDVINSHCSIGTCIKVAKDNKMMRWSRLKKEILKQSNIFYLTQSKKAIYTRKYKDILKQGSDLNM